MKKKYTYNYNCYEAEVSLKVDTEIFTEEMANETLSFFIWDYDKEANPVDEALKKYAFEAIRVSTIEECSEYGVIKAFMDKEGFAPIDGTAGIILLSVRGYELDGNNLEVESVDIEES